MSEIKISVIVPVYNVEQYLQKCLDSISSQTLKEIEIICVDDGSMDLSPEIIREFASKDNRILNVRKSNEGPGIARNVGLALSKGEYIAFVDADDWIEHDMLEALYFSAKKYNSQMVVSGYRCIDSQSGKVLVTNEGKIKFDTGSFGRNFDPESLGPNLFFISSCPWNKLYLREMIATWDIKFAENLYYQDVLFVYSSLIRSYSTFVTSEVFYNNRKGRSGSVTSDIGTKQFDIFSVLDQLALVVRSVPEQKKIWIDFIAFRERQFLFHFSKVRHSLKRAFWDEIQKRDGLNVKDGFAWKGLRFGLYYGYSLLWMVGNGLANRLPMPMASFLLPIWQRVWNIRRLHSH